LPHFPDARSVVRAFSPDEPVILNRPHAAARAARFFVEKFPGKSLYAVKANPYRSELVADLKLAHAIKEINFLELS